MNLNWSWFEVKHAGKERTAFQDMCYELFCKKFDQTDGIFAYSDHKGVETDLIQFKEKNIGFQSKYFNKGANWKSKNLEIKAAILKAKQQYPSIEELYFYINFSFYPSSIKNKQTPKYQIELEVLAIKNGFKIVWQVESHLFQQLENDRRIKLQYFPPPIELPTAEEHLSTIRTAIIQIEIKKLEYKFDHENWKEAASIIRELSLYRDYKNVVVSSSIIEFLSGVSDLCRHGMTSEVLYEITSIVKLFLPTKSGEKDSLKYFCIFRAIYIGYSLAYDSVIKLNNLEMLRNSLQFWKHIHKNANYFKDDQVIEELENNYNDLFSTVKDRKSEDFKDAIRLINIFQEDLKNPTHGTPMLPDDLFFKIERDRNRVNKKK